MSYKILSVSQREDTIITEVEYTFDDKSTVVVEIPHFMPQTKEDVLEGITNREASETRKLSAAENNKQIVAELQADVTATAVNADIIN